ncbi:MAG TPA: peptidoglycan editing factor PgeF [Rhizomicrobium sp.]|nr:peptidoglycan editing factor PgeF [Rhizomicrobium sp.]
MLVLTARNLSETKAVAHGFFGREGGVSDGVYASLNCGPGSNDRRDNVVENRRRALHALAGGAPAKLVTLYQIHSPKAVIVTEPWEIGAQPQADAMATKVPGIALGILTADCAPVLLADNDAKVIGAAHAGWKGALGGVIANVVAAMEELGARASRIRAAIGPSISQTNYEVGPEFRTRFMEMDANHARFFKHGVLRAHHWQFDLEGFVTDRLAAAGIEDIECLGACTYARANEFFSYRRTTHLGEPDYGRDISAILLR